MSRNRIIYQSLGVFVSQTGASQMQTGSYVSSVPLGTGVKYDILELSRVQSFDTDFSRNLKDVNQFGNLGFIDRLDTEAPTVSASTSYYVTDGLNESLLGLTVVTGNMAGVSCVKDILQKNTDEKNIYLMVAKEGSDASDYAGTTTGVIGLGNTFITSYSLDVAVGDIPTASVEFEALNARMYAQTNTSLSGNPVPAVNSDNGLAVTGKYFLLPQFKTSSYTTQPTALLPGDATITISGLVGSTQSELKVQKASLKFDLKRTPLNKLGSRFSFAREIDFPVTATMSVDAQLGDLSDGSVANLLCDTTTYDIGLLLKKVSCSGNGAIALSANLKGAKLVKQSIKTSIGDNATLSADFEVPISGPEDTTRGIFLSGSFDDVRTKAQA